MSCDIFELVIQGCVIIGWVTYIGFRNVKRHFGEV